MTRAACHCGAVRIVVEPAPTWVLDCNCSICRRTGALWAYTRLAMPDSPLTARIVQGLEDIEAYVWGDRWSSSWRCRTCGCVTHATPLDQPETIFCVNARQFVAFDPASVTIRRKDNGDTGHFWTRADGPILEGTHGPMPPPGPDDWR